MSTQDLDGRDCTDEATLADGEFDAAEIDKELISARLKKDILEQSKQIHLFIADSVGFSSACILYSPDLLV